MFGVSRIGAVLAIAITIQSCNGQIDSDVCPSEVSTCTGDSGCLQCLLVLQDNLDAADVTSGLACDEVYSGLCDIVEAECDATNEPLLDLFQCITADVFSCTDFTTCADVTATTLAPSATTAPAPTPTPIPDGAPTPAPIPVGDATAAPTMTVATRSPIEDGEGADAAANGGIGRFAAAGNMLPTFGLALSSAAFAIVFGQ